MPLDSFVMQYLPLAQRSSAATGLPVNFILAQSALESGNGSSYSAINRNNFFGISPGGTQARYASAADSFSAYSALMTSPRYANASAYTSLGARSLGDYINAAGYSTTTDYGARVASLVPSVDEILAKAGVDAGASPRSGSSGGGVASNGSCGFSPGCWISQFGAYLSDGLMRGVFITLGVVLVIGGVWMLGSKASE